MKGFFVGCLVVLLIAAAVFAIFGDKPTRSEVFAQDMARAQAAVSQAQAEAIGAQADAIEFQAQVNLEYARWQLEEARANAMLARAGTAAITIATCAVIVLIFLAVREYRARKAEARAK